MVKELDGDLRAIRLTAQRGDAVCATFWELAVRSIPTEGVLRIPPDFKHREIESAVAVLIGRSHAEMQKILQVLVEYKYLIPFAEGYVIPIVVRNLGPQNTYAAQQRQEARLNARGEARLNAVLMDLGVKERNDSEKDAEHVVRATDEKKDKSTTTEKQTHDARTPRKLPTLKTTDKVMARYVQLIAASLSPEKSDERDTILDLLKKLLDIGMGTEGDKG